MNLLIVTQKVDRGDTGVLGFFHNWVLEFSNYFENIIVVCLEAGDLRLPNNVKVIEIGRQNGLKKLLYVSKLISHSWRERRNYDCVLVHMNQEHVISTGLLWRLMGKTIGLWYNHKIGTWKTRLAVAFSNLVFYTSGEAFSSRYKKAIQMPVGIDTSLFKRDECLERTPKSVLSFGRISKVKKIKFVVELFVKMKRAGLAFVASVVGSPGVGDEGYYDEIVNMSRDLVHSGLLSLSKGLSYDDAVAVYNKSLIFVNPTQSGSLDKTIMEAMACECLVLVSNKSLALVISELQIFKEDDGDDMYGKIAGLLELPESEQRMIGRQNRVYVEKNHSLSLLASKLKKVYVDYK